FEHGLRALVMVNKIDRPDARPTEVLEEIFDLFVELGANDQQLEFPVVYGSGRDGYAMDEVGGHSTDLTPLFEKILKHVPSPPMDVAGPVRFQTVTLEHDDFVGRLAIGRVHRGVLRNGSRLVICHPDRPRPIAVAVKGLFRYEGLRRVAAEQVSCGDIAIVAGAEALSIGDRLRYAEFPLPPTAITKDDPTSSMGFRVNDSSFAGRVVKFVTSRQILSRVEKAAIRDVALVVERMDS